MASGKPKPPIPPKPTALLSEGGNRRPIITVSPLIETAGQNQANGVAAGDTADDACTKELAHEVTVIVEHREEAEALCNGSNDTMPATNDKVDPSTPSTSTQPVQNGEAEAHSKDTQQQQPSDSSKRNTITEDWSIKDSAESGDEACCTRLSHLIHRKAKELSTHLTKPPKPLKPAKEGKAVLQQQKSFGDEIPGGRHGIRYADEDTEASSDYQDVDLSKLAVAEVTTVAVHKEGTPKPIVEENEYEIVEAPREEVKPTPLPVAPIMVIVEDETTAQSGSSVPEATKKKTQSLEKPKRPPPPKPEATKKPRVRFGVEVFPTDIIAAIAAKKKGGAAVQEPSVSQSAAAETGAATEKDKSSDKQVQETPLEKPLLVRVMEREEPSPVLSSKMPKSMFPQSSPVKKTKPQRPPPPKIPPAMPSIHPSCSPPPPPSSPPHSLEAPAVPLTTVAAQSTTPESISVAATDSKSPDAVEDVVTEAAAVSHEEGDEVIPAEEPPCALVSQEPVIEIKVVATPPKAAADASKPTEAPRKKRTPPPRPPPPKCKWKPAETAPATTKPVVSQKPTVSPKPSFSQKPVPSRRSMSPAVPKQEVSSGTNVYSQTDDLVVFRAKNIVADLDALLAQKEAEEAARATNVSCIEASIKSMAREATHQFKPPEDTTSGNVDSKKEEELPQAPPRKRRQRSRTVEAVRVSEEHSRRPRRSHSLSEADIRIKTAQRLGRDYGSNVAATLTETFVMVLESPITKKELKDLYTNVTVAPLKERRFKEVPKPTPTTGMRFRPLPAPPPPPRGKLKLPAPAAPPGSVEDSPPVSAETAPTEAVPGPSESADTHLSQAPADEPSESQVVPESVELRTSPAKQHDSKPVSKSDSLSRQSTRSGSTSPKVRWENGEPKTFRLSNSTFYGPPLEIPPEAQRGAESPSTEPNASSEKSRSSWYDDSDASGDIADVDSPAVPSDTDPAVSSRKSDSSPGSVQRSKTRLKEKKRASAKFYCDVEAERESSTDGDVPRVSSRGSGSDRMLEAAETKGEDTDELLEMAEGLQKEMTQVLVERQKRLLESFDSELSAQRAESESREQGLVEDKESPLLMPRKDLPSVHSSASEVSWQGSSEEESDGEETRNMSLDEAARHRRKRKRMYIARELASSEQVFVDALHLLNKDFREAVRVASEERGSPIVPDDVLDQILKHLPHLVDLNEELLGQLQDRVDNWEGREQVADVLVKMGPFLKLYSSYIKDFEAMTAALEEAKRKYPEFQKVVRNFEQSTRCRQLTLQQFMLKPIQRIPQYKLLLTDYVKNLEVDTPEYSDACSALEIVSQVAQHANESMRLGDNFSKLMSLQNRISNRYEVLKPGRTFLKEGELMKVSRKEMQPRYFVLFSDSLLYLLPTPQGFYRVNYELPLSGMKVMVPPQQDYQNEFSVYTMKRSFILSASSPEEREEWISALTKAIEDNIHRKSSFHVLKKEGSQSSTSSELGREAPVWIPDQRVTMCQLCTSGFTFTHRRHHCRACGKVVCAACSSHRLPLPYLGDKPVRTCDDCFRSLHVGEPGDHPEAEGEGDLAQTKEKKRARGILQEVAANDLGSSMSGYLHQWWKKAWKRQWFVIKEHVLYVYRASEDVAALRTVPLLGFQVGAVKKGFEEVPREQLFLLEHTGLDPLIFYADTPELATRWQEAMEEASKLS
uniref:Putative rho/rac guanine nucleotide exchange factor/faciogenital dysplasia protein 3 n=1 Tax=Amblyomma aureolatum TaxID=187763 RepID=A0A1E1XGQ0_9ACAR